MILIEDALRQRRSVIARRQYCQQTLQVELIGRSEWMNQFRQRLQQLAETDIAVWFYGEHGTGRMTGARYLHQLGRNAKGPFVRYELTPENAGQLETFIDPGARRHAGVESSRISDTRTAAPSGAFTKLEHRPFRLVGVGSASLVEQAAANQIAAELYYCFAMTQIACQSLSQRPDDIEPLFRHYLRKACLRLNHPVPEIAGNY